MDYTPNFHLPQWEKDDRVMMEDFNQMTSDLEAALLQNRQAAQNAQEGVQEAQTAARQGDAALAQKDAELAAKDAELSRLIAAAQQAANAAQTTANAAQTAAATAQTTADTALKTAKYHAFGFGTYRGQGGSYTCPLGHVPWIVIIAGQSTSGSNVTEEPSLYTGILIRGVPTVAGSIVQTGFTVNHVDKPNCPKLNDPNYVYGYAEIY